MEEINTTAVEFQANGGTAPGYLAHPEGDGPFPGVVVIQEWWGITGQIKRVASRFAREGFVALVPDLYRGRVANEPDEAQKLVMDLDREQALKDIQGAVNHLASNPHVEPSRIAVLGFCMGGSLAFQMAGEGHENVATSIVFYGNPRGGDDTFFERVSAPILGLFGEEDHGISPEVVRELDRKLDTSGKEHEFVIYPGAGHAFFNEDRPAYRAEAAEDAWQRTIEWLHSHLRNGEVPA